MTTGTIWGPLPGAQLRVLSWGGGVQSTTLAAMSALGEFEKLDYAIFADTQWERRQTYRSIAFYRDWLEQRGIRTDVVSVGNIYELGAKEHIHIPFWTNNGGPLRRQCTREFKIRPIRRHVRELAGYDPSDPPHPPPGSIEQWIGFSWDESERLKDSPVKFIVNRHPLIERAMTRQDCVDWLKAHGLPVPIKSACIGCPYRTASEWIELRDGSPDEWQAAIGFDERNRHNPLAERGKSTDDEIYIYKYAQPLAKANLEADATRERQGKQLPLFLCDGPCHT